MSTQPDKINDDRFEVLDAGDVSQLESFDPISDEERRQYERDVDHVMSNDRDGDGDVDLTDAAMRKLSNLKDALRTGTGDPEAVRNRLADTIDRFDGESRSGDGS